MPHSDVPSRQDRAAPVRLAEARLGHHLAHLYATPEERAAAAADLLAGAVARGEQALGLGDTGSLDALAGAIAARGVDVATAQARGALQLLPCHEHYLPDGSFDPAQVLRAWQRRTEAALAAGFTGLVVASDMGWALGGAPGVERLLEYEAAQGIAFGGHFAGMCQYDATRFDGAVLRGVLATHALLLHGGQVLENPAALASAPASAPEPAAAELTRRLAALHAQGEAEEALRQAEERLRRADARALELVFRYRLGPDAGFDYVSASSTALTGYTPEEHYADPGLGLGLIAPEDRDRFLGALREPAAGPTLFRWRRRDGTTGWAEQQSVLVKDGAGRPVAVQGLARDVTERLAAAEALRSAAQAAGVGRLAAGVAHALHDPRAWMGAPLQVVLAALAELDAREAAGGLEELRQALGEVVEGLERVRALVGRLGAARE